MNFDLLGPEGLLPFPQPEPVPFPQPFPEPGPWPRQWARLPIFEFEKIAGRSSTDQPQ